MRDWALGTNGEWVTMGIPSGRQLRHSGRHPVRRRRDLRQRRIHPRDRPEIDAASRARMDKTLKELTDERDAIAHLLG